MLRLPNNLSELFFYLKVIMSVKVISTLKVIGKVIGEKALRIFPQL